MEPRKILFFKPGAIGDFLHTLPALKALRDRFPSAEITAAVSPGQDALIEGTAVADRVRTFDKSVYKKHPRRLFRDARELRREGYDLFVDLQPSLRSFFFRLLSGAGRCLVYRKQKRFASRSSRLHAAGNFLATLEPIGVRGSADRIALPLRPDAVGRVDRYLREHRMDLSRPLVALNCSVGAARPARNWPPERFAELGDRLTGEQRAVVVFIGGPEDRELVQSIRSLMNKEAHSAAGDLTLPETAALLARCRCLVSSDTGPLHLATAVGTPVIGLFGSTDPARTGPVGAGHQVVSKGLACIPCEEKSCPLGTTECMSAISAEDVIAAVRKVLG